MSGENVVGVDPVALNAEADALLSGAGLSSEAPPPGAAPGASAELEGDAGAGVELTYEQVQAIAARSSAGLVMMVERAGAIIAPNWKLTPDECRALGESGAVALAAWFPSGVLPLKWAVLLNFGGVVAGVVQARRDPETGELAPLKAAPPVHTNGAATAP